MYGLTTKIKGEFIIKVRVEYDPIPVRHIAVQCPDCGRWYYGNDISDSFVAYDYDIYNTQFTCPVCGKVFGDSEYRGCDDVEITEMAYPDIYKDCYTKKEVWEKK